MAFVLTFHIVAAILALVVAVGVVWATHKRRAKVADKRVAIMWLITAVTSLSGVLLMLMTGSIGMTCVSLFAFLSIIASTHGYRKLAKLAHQATRK